jgi:acyl dehydratase
MVLTDHPPVNASVDAIDRCVYGAGSMSDARGSEPSGGLFFDDFEVGATYVAGPRVITQADLEQFSALSGDTHRIHWDDEYCSATRFGRPILHGPFGIAIASGLMHSLGVFDDAVVAMRSTTWEFAQPMFVGDAISLSMTITRCRTRRGSKTGTVHRWLELNNQDGAVVQSGMIPVVMLRHAGAVDRGPVVALDFASVDWARMLADRLNDDEQFRAAAADVDAAIGFRAGDAVSYLRIFHGRVLDCTRQSDAARRFSIVGGESEWVDFAFAARNDYIARAMRGQFSVEGDVYEYLRLTGAVYRCWDHIRAMASEARRS